jgi:hypothetical protein
MFTNYPQGNIDPDTLSYPKNGQYGMGYQAYYYYVWHKDV